MGLSPLERHRMMRGMEGPNSIPQPPPGMPFPFPPHFNAAFMPYYPNPGGSGMPTNPAELFAMHPIFMQQQLLRMATQNAIAASHANSAAAAAAAAQAAVSHSPKNVNSTTPTEATNTPTVTTPTSSKKSPILKKGGFDVNDLLN
jgi:hypothetical protein